MFGKDSILIWFLQFTSPRGWVWSFWQWNQLKIKRRESEILSTICKQVQRSNGNVLLCYWNRWKHAQSLSRAKPDQLWLWGEALFWIE